MYTYRYIHICWFNIRDAIMMCNINLWGNSDNTQHVGREGRVLTSGGIT